MKTFKEKPRSTTGARFSWKNVHGQKQPNDDGTHQPSLDLLEPGDKENLICRLWALFASSMCFLRFQTRMEIESYWVPSKSSLAGFPSLLLVNLGWIAARCILHSILSMTKNHVRVQCSHTQLASLTLWSRLINSSQLWAHHQRRIKQAK